MPGRTARNKHFLLIFSFFSIWFVFEIAGAAASFSLDFDEGVYLQTALQHAGGKRLYKDLFLSQPPLFAEILAAVIRLFGPQVFPARLMVILFGGSILYLTFEIAKLLFDERTALVALVLTGANWYLFHESKVVHMNIPSLAFALMSLYGALRYHRKGSIVWLLIAALSFGLSVSVKLLEVFFVFPIFFLIAARARENHRMRQVSFAAAGEHYQEEELSFDVAKQYHQVNGSLAVPAGSIPGTPSTAGRFERKMGKSVWMETVWATAVFASLALAAASFMYLAYPIRHLANQVFGMGSSSLFRITSRARIIVDAYLGWNLGIVLFAVPGMYLCARSNKKIFWFLTILIFSQILFHLLMSEWVWHHHLIVLLPVFSILAAYSAVRLFQILREKKRVYSTAFTVLFVLLACITNIAGSAYKHLEHTKPDFSRAARHLKDLIEENTASSDLVVCDQPMALFRSRRRTFGDLVDVSQKRINTGSLREETLLSYGMEPALVAFWTGRLAGFDTYRRFVAEHYLLLYKENGREVYIKQKHR